MSETDEQRYKRLKAMRGPAKVTNYSSLYGVGAAKLARETGMTEKEAKALLDAFWELNWAVKKIASQVRTRELFGSMWLQNPVSGFWYSLRNEKDSWSTLNQSTGVFCFDTWVAICRKNGIKSIGQFHDEIIVLTKEGDEDKTENIMQMSINNVNDAINLNVPLGTDVQFGKTYADIH